MPRFSCLLGIALMVVAPAEQMYAQGKINPFHLRLLAIASEGLSAEGAAAEPGQAGPRLFIKVVEGENAVNNIKARTAREPVIEVDDENHKPVGGALVTFFTPNQGPGGLFGNQQTLTTMTDATGRAVGKGFKPNNAAGQFNIEVTVSFAGQIAKALVAERNIMPEASAHVGTQTSSGIFGSKVLVIVGVAAAATTAGVVYAVAHNGTSTPTATIGGPGNVTVGPSH